MSNWSYKDLPPVSSEQDYKAIVLWGRKLGSYDYYIQVQLKKAKADKAPLDAIYKRDNGTWAKLGDIKDLEARQDMREFLKLS